MLGKKHAQKSPALPMKAVERILRDAGAARVSKDATSEFASWLEKVIAGIAKDSASLAEHAGRRTMDEHDVSLAARRAIRK